MLLQHFSDLHIGFERGTRTDSLGVNVRARDVERSLDNLLQQALTIRPDIVVAAGDIFHVAQPLPHAEDVALSFFRQLVEAGIACFVPGGNHDRSRYLAKGQVLALLRQVGVHVADDKPESFTVTIRGKSVRVLCVPECAAKVAEYLPDATADYNVLAVHVGLKGTIPNALADLLPFEALNAEAFHYVALGDYHNYKQLADNAFYSGAIELTTTDVFGEDHTKGFILRNLETGAHEFRALPGIRAHVDLPVIYADKMPPSDIDAAIAANVAAAEGGVAGKVVRQRILGIENSVKHTLDWRAIRKLRSAALIFDLKCEVPEVTTVGFPNFYAPIEDDNYTDADLYALLNPDEEAAGGEIEGDALEALLLSGDDVYESSAGHVGKSYVWNFSSGRMEAVGGDVRMEAA